MKFQRNAFLGAMAISSLLLTACGANPADGSESGASGSADSGEQSVITVWTIGEGYQMDVWNEMVAAFEAKNPNVKVVTEVRATDPHKDALRQAVGTDAMPDVYRYWAGPGLGGELVEVGASVDISDLYEKYSWAEVLTPPAYANVTQYGGHHGVPLVQTSEAVFYNKALFAEAGIEEPPESYDELVAAAEKLKAAGITPMEFGGTVNWHVMRLLDSLIETKCGADKSDELTGGDGNWATEPCVTEAFTELKKWGDDFLPEGYMGISNDDSSQLFYSGQAAMTIEGTWFGPMTLEGGMNPEDVGMFAFPTGTDRLYGFGELLYVTPKGAEKPMVGEFLDFTLSEQGLEIMGDEFSVISVNKNIVPGDDVFLGKEWVELVGSAGGAYINNDQNFSTAETTEFWRVQNSVLSGGLSPEKAGAEFQAWRDSNNE